MLDVLYENEGQLILGNAHSQLKIQTKIIRKLQPLLRQ